MDPHGRRLDYLRLAVTDRCNLRCRYCMPAAGIPLTDRDAVLGWEELERLVALLVSLGVRKVRVTGGEPLVRRGVSEFLSRLARLPVPPERLLTTNGLLLAEHLDALQTAGVRRVNVSLDSLRPGTFRRLARRDGCRRVVAAVDRALAAGLTVKVNVVVVPGVNDGELSDFVGFIRRRPVTVRFIEPMPFDGGFGDRLPALDGDAIVARLRRHADLEPDGHQGVADLYRVPGCAGRLGVIRGHSRTFCGDCSRLRLDARGRLRTCLYGDVAAELGAALRAGADDSTLADLVRQAVAGRHPHGRAAEAARRRRHHRASMAGIGG